MKQNLTNKTFFLVKRYFNLNIGPHVLRCPYFQNVRMITKLPVFVGKGLPEEIEKETLKLFKNNQKNLIKLDPQSVRQYMVMGGLGIDCSGFVARILDSLLNERHLGGIVKNIKPENTSLISLLKHYIRTFTNLSADTLTSYKNCVEIKEFDEVIPGDLIRAGYGHVAIITKVDKVNRKTKCITYCHSTYDYLDESGVRQGNILIINPNKPLEKQRWDEHYLGRNWMLEDYFNAKSDERGIRRLKVFQNI